MQLVGGWERELVGVQGLFMSKTNERSKMTNILLPFENPYHRLP